MQQSLFDPQDDNTAQQVPMPDADVRYFPRFILADKADYYLATLQQNLAWRQEHIRLYGKTFAVPRLQAWYGDKDSHYQYSNLLLQPTPWTDDLLRLKKQCEQAAKVSFNSVLANLYRDGQDGMGRHADNEPELGEQPVIASVSFGQTRALDFYHQKTKQKVRIALEHGSLLLMRGQTQHFWQHGIAKSNRAMAARINLTFRKIYS